MSKLEGAIEGLGQAAQDLLKYVGSVRQAARADDKTPLLNGLALNEASQRIGSPDGPSIVVFGDLNGFKALNDANDHATGDAALNQIGQMIETLVIKGCEGEAYHPSGDEFVILLKESRLESFLRIAPAFAACAFVFNNKSHATRMSFGYAKADGKADLLKLRERAELACQIAKKKGHGECVLWSAELERNAMIEIRFPCSCGATNRCDHPVGEEPANYHCCRCGKAREL